MLKLLILSSNPDDNPKVQYTLNVGKRAKLNPRDVKCTKVQSREWTDYYLPVPDRSTSVNSSSARECVTYYESESVKRHLRGNNLHT